MIKRKIKLFSISFVFFLSQVAHSQEVLSLKSDLTSLTEYMNYVSEFTAIVNHEVLQQQSSYQLSSNQVADSCTAFIDEDHFLGRTGTSIFNEITKHSGDYPNLIQGGALNRYCRKYSSMGIRQKGLVWVLLLTMMAHYESSCSISAKAKGPNGIAQGYFQLHKGKEQNYSDDRSACSRNASLSPAQSSACALAMLDDQFEKTNGKLFYSESYWDVLRPNGESKKASQIANALRKSSLCNPKSI